MTGEGMTRTDPPSPLFPHPPALVDLPRLLGGQLPLFSLPQQQSLLASRAVSVRTVRAVARDAVGSFLLACPRSAARAPGANRRGARRVPGAADCRWCLGPSCPCSACCACCLCCLCSVSRTLARRPRSERRRGFGSAKAVRGDLVHLGVLGPAWPVPGLRRRACGRPVGALSMAAWLLVQGHARVLLSRCARSGPRRRRGEDRRRRLGRRRAARRFSGAP